jgi:HPt (histidine-containing phosphotransfer) domain-containing protein
MSPAEKLPTVLDEGYELPPHLLELFLSSAPRQLQDLVDACARRDAAAARAQAHKLKGGLYASGASRLAESVESLRGVLGVPDWRAGESQLQAIVSDFAVVCRELELKLKRGKP